MKHLRPAGEHQAMPHTEWTRMRVLTPEGTVEALPPDGVGHAAHPPSVRIPEKQQARACQGPQTLPAVQIPQGLELVIRLLRQVGGHAGARAAGGRAGGTLSLETALVAHASVTVPAKAGRGRQGLGTISSSCSCWAQGAWCPPRPGLSHCSPGWSWGLGTHSSSHR